MFLRKLLKNRDKVEHDVYMDMKNIDAHEQKKDNTVIVIDDQVDVIHRQNDSGVLNSQLNETKNMDPQQVTSAIRNINEENNSSRRKNHRLVERFGQEENLRTTTPTKDVQDNLDPILEYAQEPLLPLTQACAPLVNIIHDLSVYIRIALNETPHEPPDGLTLDESAAVRLYTMEWEGTHRSLYSTLNATLKKSDRHDLRPYFKYLKLFLTALVKLPCAPLQTVWRGVNKDLSKDFPPGISMTWWAFSSCTTSLTVLENNIYLANVGERTLFSVEAINGRIIRAHSHFDDEDEILLLPGTYMEVHSQLSPAAGLHIIHLKQIIPIKTLLALPFEGALLYPPEKKKVPWYRKKRTIVELTLLISLCLAGIIVGSVLGTRRSPPPPICRTRSTRLNTDLFWSFDCGDAREDLKGLINGTDENGAQYSSPDFSGQGKALSLTRRLSQYVRLPQSLNLGINTSFTVSVWMFSTGYNRATILNDCNALNSVCIELFVYSVNIYAFAYNWNNDSLVYLVEYQAWKVNYQSCWIHLTFSFDNQTNNLWIYFNGDPMASGYFAPSDFVTNKTNASMTSYIGSAEVPTNRDPFDGLLDQLSISYHVKNSSEILDEATLLCQYNFDINDINDDSGPNNIQAYSENVYRSSSNNQSGLLFNSSDSYFQSSGFTLLMSKFYEFTIAFWLRPIIIKSDKVNSAIAILQFASKVQQISSESYVCFLSILIANSSTEKPYFRIDFGQLNMFIAIDWAIVQNNTWTHVGVSYSNSSSFSAYVNGINSYFFIDNRFSLLLFNPRLAVTVGGSYFDETIAVKPSKYESRKCFAQNPQFNFVQMSGEIDDLKVFARALSDSDFATLASSKNKST